MYVICNFGGEIFLSKNLNKKDDSFLSTTDEEDFKKFRSYDEVSSFIISNIDELRKMYLVCIGNLTKPDAEKITDCNGNEIHLLDEVYVTNSVKVNVIKLFPEERKIQVEYKDGSTMKIFGKSVRKGKPDVQSDSDRNRGFREEFNISSELEQRLREQRSAFENRVGYYTISSSSGETTPSGENSRQRQTRR